MLMELVVSGWELAHLARFMERVHDDDEVHRVRVIVRTTGTLEFFGGPWMYSAEIGCHDYNWDGED
ncbi:hypothetical protein A5727_22995 [Mycobacterium sp. ACS4331]|nr:hypothetical protein A5727_22995 [Mycobacterium sp. ACS4331]